jgi:hypothetical protein
MDELRLGSEPVHPLSVSSYTKIRFGPDGIWQLDRIRHPVQSIIFDEVCIAPLTKHDQDLLMHIVLVSVVAKTLRVLVIPPSPPPPPTPTPPPPILLNGIETFGFIHSSDFNLVKNWIHHLPNLRSLYVSPFTKA